MGDSFVPENEKKPWSSPTAKRIELTEELLQLFRSRGVTVNDAGTIRRRNSKSASA